MNRRHKIHVSEMRQLAELRRHRELASRYVGQLEACRESCVKALERAGLALSATDPNEKCSAAIEIEGLILQIANFDWCIKTPSVAHLASRLGRADLGPPL
jgi:hypothetical protein